MTTIRCFRLAGVLAVILSAGHARAQTPAVPRSVESNVVYGMYSGLALLMDVHRPTRANGLGVLLVAGSGFTAPMAYNAPPLKQNRQVEIYGRTLLEAGYTVFAVNHRAAPRFRYPAAVEDVQRAIRFVRHNAKRFDIDGSRLGAIGSSSGGYLVSMVGTLSAAGDAADADPVNRESAALQAVVARAASSDLRTHLSTAAAAFIGMIPTATNQPPPPASIEYRTFRDASPIHHVTKDDPPFFLVHGDADAVVPFRQSEMMEQALREAGIPVKLHRIAGGEHADAIPGVDLDYLSDIVRWFDLHLKNQ